MDQAAWGRTLPTTLIRYHNELRRSKILEREANAEMFGARPDDLVAVSLTTRGMLEVRQLLN